MSQMKPRIHKKIWGQVELEVSVAFVADIYLFNHLFEGMDEGVWPLAAPMRPQCPCCTHLWQRTQRISMDMGMPRRVLS
jgi:hypothetical protein